MTEDTSSASKRTISIPQPDEDAARLAKYQHQNRCLQIALTCGGIAMAFIGWKLASAIIHAYRP